MLRELPSPRMEQVVQQAHHTVLVVEVDLLRMAVAKALGVRIL